MGIIVATKKSVWFDAVTLSRTGFTLENSIETYLTRSGFLYPITGAMTLNKIMAENPDNTGITYANLKAMDGIRLGMMVVSMGWTGDVWAYYLNKPVCLPVLSEDNSPGNSPVVTVTKIPMSDTPYVITEGANTKDAAINTVMKPGMGIDDVQDVLRKMSTTRMLVPVEINVQEFMDSIPKFASIFNICGV